jgi:hypothetical protein
MVQQKALELNRKAARWVRMWVLAVASLVLLAPAAAESAPKTTKAKKKSKTTTKAVRKKSISPTTPAKLAAPRGFSCQGSGGLQLNERIVTGTVTSNIVVTNVTVTKTHQFINDAIVAQPIVDLVSPNPPGAKVPLYDLIAFELNKLPPATAGDVGKIMSVYRLNFASTLPVGPTFKTGLFFDSWKAAAGPADGQFQWNLIPSVAVTGSYDMDCSYI